MNCLSGKWWAAFGRLAGEFRRGYPHIRTQEPQWLEAGEAVLVNVGWGHVKAGELVAEGGLGLCWKLGSLPSKHHLRNHVCTQTVAKPKRMEVGEGS